MILNPDDQIKWYFNKHRIRDTPILENKDPFESLLLHRKDEIIQNAKTLFGSKQQFSIKQKLHYDINSTTSTLIIMNFNIKINISKYKCEFKGLSKTIKIIAFKNGNLNIIHIKIKNWKIGLLLIFKKSNFEK